MSELVMDNCCGCGHELAGTAKQIVSRKAWGGYWPYISFACKSGSGSREPIETDPFYMPDWVAFAENITSDDNAPVRYRTATGVFHLNNTFLNGNNEYEERSLDVTLIRTLDRRDGAVIFQSMSFSPNPVPDGWPGLSGLSTCSSALQDDGSYVLTGTQPIAPQAYIEPIVDMGQYVPSNWYGQSGWECTITPTNNFGSVSGQNMLGPLPMTEVTATNTWNYTLSDPYFAGPPDDPSALNDARQMLLGVNWDDVPDGGQGAIYYVRDVAGIRTQIDYSEEGASGGGWMEFDGAEATAGESFFDNSDQGVCSGSELIQLPMEASTGAYPGNGHWVSDGRTVITHTKMSYGQVIVDPFYANGWLLSDTWGSVQLVPCSTDASLNPHDISTDTTPL